MIHDDIIKEVRAIRERLAAGQDYSVHALFEEAKERQQESGRQLVRLAPRLIEAVSTPSASDRS